MSEIIAGVTLVTTAAGTAKLIEKVLGPTAEYLGENLRDRWVKRRYENVVRIFEKAAEDLGDKLDRPGTVPPKVLKGVLQEGPFCADELSAEYFGGVLASSRSEVPRDDRGAAMVSLVSRLTTYQIRTHFLFYHIVKSLLDGQNLSFTHPEQRSRIWILIPSSIYCAGMDFSERENYATIIPHSLQGLYKEDLIGPFMHGSSRFLQEQWKDADEPGFVSQPSPLGIELFLWAYGKGDLLLTEFLNPNVRLRVKAGVTVVQGAKHLQPKILTI